MGKVLVLNTGSSSVKFALYDPGVDNLTIRGGITRMGTRSCTLSVERFYTGEKGEGEVVDGGPCRVKDADAAVPFILDLLLKENRIDSLHDVALIGHRVVHGGKKYDKATLVTEDVLKDISYYSRYAPLHNPHNLRGIRRCQHLLKGVPNVAVFDTAFHRTLPAKACLYGLKPELDERHGIRKYGFHGTNHKWCAHRAAEFLGGMPRRLVTCHLGNGSSVTAIKDGQSVETSMGFTPLDGVIMGTRPGSLDPGIVLQLLIELKLKPEDVARMLNQESGLLALGGKKDVRDLWKLARDGDKRAIIALDKLASDVVKHIGAYAATLNGLDCLVFSGGIGENAWYIRSEVCQHLGHLGVLIDTEKNQRGEHDISAPGARVKTFIVAANEELQIARETYQHA